MSPTSDLNETLRRHGVTRRAFLKLCAGTAAALGLPAGAAPALARALEGAPRPALLWLSFQGCTGCTESLIRAEAPTLEELILRHLSLDYHHTLQAASGAAAEAARRQAMREQAGRYLIVVDGAIPDAEPGYCTIAGRGAKDLLLETAAAAGAVIALGSCAAFGGIPAAVPNPTGAVAVQALIGERPLVNVPGCPPIPAVIAAVVAHFLAFGALPELDELRRPRAFYGHTIHDHCPRRGFYEKGLFAERFDDAGARQGWCLLKLGCKGPSTHNACATLKWNGGTGFPIQAGHGCIGCSEPGFWDAGGLYQPLFDGFFSAWMWWLRHPGGRRPPPAAREPSTPIAP